MAMNMLTPQQIADKWAGRLGQSAQAYQDGVNSVQISPMELAAQNIQGYLNGVQEAVNSGKYQAGLRRATLQDWKSKCTQVGAQRLATGATAAKPKMQAFLADFLPFLANNVAQVRAMPKGTFEDRMARMDRMARLNHQYRRGG